jgi:hypothetical protein
MPWITILSNYYFGGKALTWKVLKFYEKQGVTHMIAMWSSDHSAIHRDPHLRLAIANDLSPAIGITRIDQKWPYETKASIQHLWPNAHPRIIIKQKEKQSSRTVVRCTRVCLALAQGECPRLVLAPAAPWVTQIAQVWDTNKSAMHGVQSTMWCMIRSIVLVLTHKSKLQIFISKLFYLLTKQFGIRNLIMCILWA